MNNYINDSDLLSYDELRYRLKTTLNEHDLIEKINENVNSFRKEMKMRDINLRKDAGILVILYKNNDNQIHVLLTQRTVHLSSHSGQVCCPGGKKDESDIDLIHTSLRETFEEIGLKVDRNQVICCMQPTLAASHVVVTPIVAVVDHKLEPKDFIANFDEVDCIFTCPLNVFLSEQYHRTAFMTWHGSKFRLHYFDVPVDILIPRTQKKRIQTIWGLTARVMIEVALAVYKRKPEFATDYSSIFTHNSTLESKI